MQPRISMLLSGAVAMTALFALSGPLSDWVTSRISSTQQYPIAGRILSFDGQIKRIHEGRVEIFTSKLEKPLEVSSRERIEVDAGSKAILQLNSNDELELQPLSAVSLQLWNEKDPGSAVYLNIIAGDAELKKPGVAGKAYVVREGRLFSPNQKASQKALALTVLKDAPLDMELAAGVDVAAPDTEFETTETENEDPAPSLADPETLSNEYIDGMISGRQSQLQKCWISRLKDNPELKGQLVLQFEISRRGKVKEIKVADSTMNDEALKKCVLDVVERISFRSFKGPEISLTYPINFE